LDLIRWFSIKIFKYRLYVKKVRKHLKRLLSVFLGLGELRGVSVKGVKNCHGKAGGISSIVSEALITGIVVSLGILLLYFASSWSMTSASTSVNQINKEIAQQWSLLTIEYVSIPSSGSSAYLWVSNPGRYDLVVIYCAVYPKGSQPPAIAYGEIAEVGASMKEVVKLTCPVSGSAGSYVAEVRALPKTLYNPSDPLTNIQYSILVRVDVNP
jgi:hypothetical protein